MNKEDYELIKKEFENETIQMKPFKFTKEILYKLLKQYTNCRITEKWYDSREGKEFNNWIDEYDKGVWYMTNMAVRKMCNDVLELLNKYQYDEYKNDTRIYIGKDNKVTQIYFYGRDIEDELCDYWFEFYNEEINKCTFCNKEECKKDVYLCDKGINLKEPLSSEIGGLIDSKTYYELIKMSL